MRSPSTQGRTGEPWQCSVSTVFRLFEVLSVASRGALLKCLYTVIQHFGCYRGLRWEEGDSFKAVLTNL